MDYFDGFEFEPNSTFDLYFGKKAQMIKKGYPMSPSLSELAIMGFSQIAGTDLLVNKSKKDLWQIESDGKIVRCFSDDDVIKG